jgi:hypothetical protein
MDMSLEEHIHDLLTVMDETISTQRYETREITCVGKIRRIAENRHPQIHDFIKAVN